MRRGYARIDMRGKPKKFVVVKIKRAGRKTRTRRFQTCVPSR